MKIAVSCNGNQIWAHFGHCENFMIYEAENGVITSEQSVPNPGHRPGFLPNFLADMGVAVIISGGGKLPARRAALHRLHLPRTRT